MSDPQIKKLAMQLSLGERAIQATVELLDSGATLPFIARYRKEATGNLDEVAIARIRDLLFRNRLLEERREAILHSLAKRSLLTDDLQEKLLAADTLARLEDIYLPFRPKRKTRATAAKERGLEPLARRIFAHSACSTTTTPTRPRPSSGCSASTPAPDRTPWSQPAYARTATGTLPSGDDRPRGRLGSRLRCPGTASGLARHPSQYHAHQRRWHAVAIDARPRGRGKPHEAIEATGATEAEALDELAALLEGRADRG
jgi:hypothetical protein